MLVKENEKSYFKFKGFKEQTCRYLMLLSNQINQFN